ncbi:DUF2235 domain-containing protein [Aquabacterium sp.]|uniref:T6SS phospholipase effector Tle1-like catalytic domain-containing protein n=1 Tax=Aquabacterium sp. TaxID=1872578 RepID=UPI0035B4D4B2
MINSNKAPSEKSGIAGPALKQNLTALLTSASAHETLTAPVVMAPVAPMGGMSLLDQARTLHHQMDQLPAAHTCQLVLRVGFFFDGTGNNLDADLGTDEHSNVARLFKAYPDDLEHAGTFKYYVPGLGTYFRDIGDIGDDDGARFARHGDARLDKAMQWLDEAIARHPVDKIAAIEVYLFGFSRGATLARAFARRIQDRCTPSAGAPHRHVWTDAGKSFSIRFMGLFDTVASVGIPASAGWNSFLVAMKWRDLELALEARRRDDRSGLAVQAFGSRAGADPTPNSWDGHSGWASNLRVPPVVQRTVHLMAMNEIRNSFPLDTIWDGSQLPPNAAEIVYPGAHSDVGGGYRPGEEGKSATRGLMLSKIPLRKMYDEAVLAGVPLLSLDMASNQADFAFDPELQSCFNEVMAHAELKGGLLGASLLSHSKLYLKWRFRKIRLKLRAQDTPAIESTENVYRREDQAMRERLSAMEADPQRRAAERDMIGKKSAWESLTMSAPAYEHAAAHADYVEAKERFDALNDPYLKERAKLRTLPSHDGELVGNLEAYDRQLMRDVAFLKAHAAHAKAPLRPHYQTVIQAHDEEFLHGQGLTNEHVIEFFDTFVHDSLAGFAKDVTLPSDPRCCYIGGDDELKYANHQPVRSKAWS